MQKTRKYLNLKQSVVLICYFIITLLCLMMAINVFNNSFISFDGGWNAQVAANYAKTGEYETTWPKNTVFYNVITTGQTMLLPAAWIFKLCGLSFETIAFVPLCFMIGFILTLYVFIYKMIKELLINNQRNENKHYVLSHIVSLIILVIMWSVLRLVNYSFDLCGEGATLFFIIIGLIGINNYKNESKHIWLIIVGMVFVCAVVTKMVAICFVSVALFILIVYIIQNNKVKDILVLLYGMCITFCVVDFIKFQQLEYNLINYTKWWLNYLKYCFGLNQADSNISVIEKMLYYENIFQLQKLWGILALVIGVLVLAYVGYQGGFKKKWHIPIEVFICGAGGVSYLLVSIFISKGGALEARRLVVHFAFFLLYLLMICTQIIIELIGTKRDYRKNNLKRLINILVKVCGIVIVCISITRAFGSGLKHLVSLEPDRRQEQELLLEQVTQLPEDAKLVTMDWRFASAMSTLRNMEIVNMDEVDFKSGSDYYYIAEEYLVQEILNSFEYNVIYKKNKDSFKPCIVQLVEWKNTDE